MIQRKPYEQDEKLKEAAEEAKHSLHFLCHQFLGYNLWDSVHDDIEVMLRKPSQRKCIVLPRDHSKSTFVTIAWSIQQILKNPNVRILIANGVWDQSRKFLSEIKAQLENSQLKYLFGEFQSARWNSDDIIVRQRTKPQKEPTVFTTGVEAESTGSRADIIIADDLMGEQNYKTPEQREKVKKFRRSLVNLLEPGGIMIDIMTRWHLDDTFSEIMEKERKFYDVMVRKVVEDGKLIYPMKFSKRFDPKRKEFVPAPNENCLDYVEYLRQTKPADEFASQYLNEPISSENAVFKADMFKYWNQRPEGLYVGMAVDFALSEQKQSDRTAVVTLGMDSKYNIYVLDYLAFKTRSPQEIVGNIFNERAKWKPNVVGMEVNGFQRTLKLACEDEMRRRRDYFPIEEIRTGPEKSKENRIKSLEPFYRNGAVFHAAWMKGKDMETEMLTFPKGRHDDIIDAMSMCLPFLHPGTAEKRAVTPEGSWEWWYQKARDSNLSYRSFFDHSV